MLRLGSVLYVGLSTRTNLDGARLLADLVKPLGYSVECVRTTACLHLKSAVTAVEPDRVLCNPEWIDASIFRDARVDVIAVDPSEPHAANVLRVGHTDPARRQSRTNGCRSSSARLQRVYGGRIRAGQGRGRRDVL